MVGLMQIMIYLLCVYLIYKGVEIFQIAYTKSDENRARKSGVVIGIMLTALAVLPAGVTVVLTEAMVADMQKNLNNNPMFRP